MQSWASDYLDEDAEMTDPMFYPTRWQQARLAALSALSAAAHKGRNEEAERRELTPDECWEPAVLVASGICPQCRYPAHDGQCKGSADGR
jgi:hypothetical protein